MRQRHGNFVSQMAWLQENLAVDDFNLINVLTDDEVAHEKLIRELTDEAYAICEKLDVVRPLSQNLRHAHAYLCFAKANLNTDPTTGLPDIDLNRRAASLYQKLVDENPAELAPRGNLFLVLLQLADALDAHRRGGESRTAENDAFVIANGRVDILLQGGYFYATSCQGVDKLLATLDASTRRQIKERYAARVVPPVARRSHLDSKTRPGCRDDPAFAPFQTDPEFQAVVLDMKFPSKPFGPGNPRSRSRHRPRPRHLGRLRRILANYRATPNRANSRSRTPSSTGFSEGRLGKPSRIGRRRGDSITATYNGDVNLLGVKSKSTSAAVSQSGTTVVLVTLPVLKKKKLKSEMLTAEIEPISPGGGFPAGTVTFEMLTKKKKKTKTKILGTTTATGGTATLTVKPKLVPSRWSRSSTAATSTSPPAR